MSVRTRYFFGWLAACALALSQLVSGDALASEAQMFQVKAEGDGANAVISIEDKAAVLDIRSRGGIGRVTVEHVSGPLPEQIVVRLHLKGLEEFRLRRVPRAAPLAVISCPVGAEEDLCRY